MNQINILRFPETNPCGKFFNEVIFTGNIYEKYSNYDPMRRRWLTDSSLLVGHDNYRDEMLINFKNETVQDVGFATTNMTTISEMSLFINQHFSLIPKPSALWMPFLQSGESLYEGVINNKGLSLTKKKRGEATIFTLILYQLKF